ncbi:MAG: DUF4402 domain-containing protein [Bacteroidales bacterium]|nr:DUF4402 domain-containing protein [Bacteroidales bacterium]
MNKSHYITSRKGRHLIIITGVFSVLLALPAMGQEPPPRPLTVTLQQDLSFGAFYHGAAGGSVAISPAGSRTFTGDIVLLTMGYTFSAAVFRLTGPPGTVVSLLKDTGVTLSGSNGGSLSLQIGDTTPLSPFVTPAGPLLLNVGGTITIGNSADNPPGNYSGTFDITFVQE